LQRSEKEKENFKIELGKLTDELHDRMEQVIALNRKEGKLQKIIQDADIEREKQKKEMEQVNGNHIIFYTLLSLN
jgi:hypothetical protein